VGLASFPIYVIFENYKSLTNLQNQTNTYIMQIKRLISLLTLSSIALFSSVSLRADVFALWGNTNTSTMSTPTIVDTAVVSAGNLTGVNLTTGNPVNMSPHGTSTYNYAGWSRSSATGGGGYNNTTLTVAQVLADATYFQFTITPNVGQTISIDSISFDCMAGTATTTANREFLLLSSATGYTATDILLAGGTQPTIGGYTFTTPTIPLNNSTIGDQNYLVDLSGNSAFANLTGPVNFRIYVGTDTVSQNLGFSQLTVNGAVVPVPEPSTVAFVGFGLAGLLALNRRRLRA
jgi:hypothetical protein